MAPLHGVIPPLITPLTANDELDVPHLEKLIEYQLQGGIHGLFLLGTTGEGPSLSDQVKKDVVQHVCRVIRGRVPVLVNVSDVSLVETISLARHAAAVGAQALVLTCPYYFPLDQTDLWLYLEKAVKSLPLPVYLYNMPSHVKVSMSMEVLERAIQLPGILGIKDSSGDRDYFHALLKLSEQRPEWSVMVGPEELFVDAVSSGGHGGVLGGANLYPRLLVQLFHALRAKDTTQIEILEEKMGWFHQHVLRMVGGPNGWLVGLKTALSLLGYCQERFAEPLHPMNEEQRRHLMHSLEELRQVSEF